MAKVPYDPNERRERYLRERELQGRKPRRDAAPTTSRPAPPVTPGGHRRALGLAVRPKPKPNPTSASIAKIGRLKEKISKLQTALSETLQTLSEKRVNARKEAKKDSDGKTTAKERQDSKEYRDKHKAELASKRKAKGDSGGGDSKSSSSSSSSESGGLSSMSEDELHARVGRLQSAIKEAKRQLAEASSSVGKLRHSVIPSDVLMSDILPEVRTSGKDSVQMKADFSGYATMNDLVCSDGRTILAGAFDHHDGQMVPLVWQHGHADVENVLGHVKLEKRDNGTYCHAYFNKTAKAQHAKEMVEHGDVKWLSIFANKLVEKTTDAARRMKDVMKGDIKEVSLVLGGANPGAMIDNVAIAHGEDFDVVVEEAVITTGVELVLGDGELAHADDDKDEKSVEDVLSTLNEEQAAAVTYLFAQKLTHSALGHSDTDPAPEAGEGEGEPAAPADGAPAEAPAETPAETAPEGQEPDPEADPAPEAGDSSDPEADPENGNDPEADPNPESGNDPEAGDGVVQHSDSQQEDNSMTQNVFDQSGTGSAARPVATLQHGDLPKIIDMAKTGNGSLRDAFKNFATASGITVGGELQHGIENIEYLFPDAKLLENSPAFVSRRQEWVEKVLGSVRKSPIARIKTISADITPDEARARGYIKGNLKNEEFFEMSKRETTPQTIYKKQKLDRDDVIDIVDLDVVAWLKAEMKVMLDEELAGAILVGDGRSSGDDDKIFENKIRPVASDAELYVTNAYVNLGDANSTIEELVDSAITNRQYYKGSGTPTFFTSEAIVAKFLTVKDNFGRRLYKDLSEVADALRCKEVVPIEVMGRAAGVIGIMVNLADYTLGADRGGQATMFDDFDIDYNKLRYLIETRVSGALTQPKSAVVFRQTADNAVLKVPTAPTFADNTVTVPTITGVVYKDGDNNTLTTGAPVELEEGESLHVKATPSGAGYFFENDAQDEWDFAYDEDA